jgi:hypothetical protein
MIYLHLGWLQVAQQKDIEATIVVHQGQFQEDQ